MDYSKLTVNCMIAGLMIWLPTIVNAVPPHLPNLVTGGNMWTVTAYRDSNPGHTTLISQTLCFLNDGVIGTHQKYIWASITFPDWNGRAQQEGDQIFMHGDFTFAAIPPGHDAMEWQIVTGKEKTMGTGHWKAWLDDKKFGSSIAFANITFERVAGGECNFSIAAEALKNGQTIPLKVRADGTLVNNPMGVKIK